MSERFESKVSDSLDNVPNENVVTQLVTDRQTNQLSDQLLELLEWLFATKNDHIHHVCCILFIYWFMAEQRDKLSNTRKIEITSCTVAVEQDSNENVSEAQDTADDVGDVVLGYAVVRDEDGAEIFDDILYVIS